MCSIVFNILATWETSPQIYLTVFWHITLKFVSSTQKHNSINFINVHTTCSNGNSRTSIFKMGNYCLLKTSKIGENGAVIAKIFLIWYAWSRHCKQKVSNRTNTRLIDFRLAFVSLSTITSMESWMAAIECPFAPVKDIRNGTQIKAFLVYHLHSLISVE